MEKDNDYVERLEKIIDKQDDLLTHLDAKFDQQQKMNDELSKQNHILREDIKKHKTLLMDMNKTVNQHKNVVKKLKKELEDQLKIQQDLHKDYGEVIKELTDELEAEQNKNNANVVKEEKPKDKDSSKKSSNKVELPPKEHQTDYVASATNLFSDMKEKSSEAAENLSASKNDEIPKEQPKKDDKKVCPSCGADVQEGYVFCESCGTKLN